MGLKDRLDKLTGGSDGEYSGETRHGDVDYEDFAQTVECLGEMFIYAYAAEKKLEQSDSVDAEIRLEEVKEIASNNLDVVGIFDVVEICDKHGIDFESEVIEKVGDG